MSNHDLMIGDERLSIQITDDGLEAYLAFRPNDENDTIEDFEIRELIESAGITHGLMNETIEGLKNHRMDTSHVRILIAKGTPARDGEDSRLDIVYQQQATDRERDENEVIDYFSFSHIANVTKGQLLAKKIPATKGIDGLTVTGVPIPAVHGKDMRIKVGKNVVFHEEEQALYAAIDGQVSISDAIHVFPVFEVNGDLDLSVGNIDFVGNVVIRGNVPNGYKVTAKGDIRITGLVEGAVLQAGGSIEIQSGISAQKKGEIIAAHDLYSKFINNAKVNAGKNVYVTQSIMHSNVRAGDMVQCLGDKGLIVGGKIQAGKAIKCRTIGNMMTTPTEIEVGYNPDLANRRREIVKKIQQMKETLTKTEQALNVLAQLSAKLGSLPPDKLAMKEKLLSSKESFERELNDLLQEQEELTEQMKQEEEAFVEASSMIYPGTKIVLGRYTKHLKEQQQRLRYKLFEHQIVSEPIV